MKKITLVLAMAMGSYYTSAQNNVSGSYGYAFKPQGSTGNDKNATGPEGHLTLLKMEGNKYRFWLDVTIGWPNYNQGATDGTITLVNDTASFDNTFEGADNPCILKFKVSGNNIHINSMSSSFNCGFGNGVNADGDYTRLKAQPVMNNAWLKKQYFQTPTLVITAKKAELFQDENGRRPYAKPQYFNKGESLLSIAETEKTIYTEYFTPAGKFVYGWLKKTDVKVVE